MKKNLLIIGLMLITMSLTSCREEHVHSKTAWVGDSTHHWHECLGCSDLLDKAEHDFGEWVTKIEATETSVGSKERKCNTCSYKEEETISKLAHQHTTSDWVEDSTHHWKNCSSCPELVDKATHNFGKWEIITDSTVSKTGLQKRTCEVCEYVEEEVIPVKEHDHQVGDWERNDEQHWKVCSICTNDVYKDNHNWDEGVEEIIATDTSGRISYTCEGCGYNKKVTSEKFYTLGKLVDKANDTRWDDGYEAFDAFARRDNDSISLRYVSLNSVFTSEGRDSRLETYFVVGNNMYTRTNNSGVTRINITSNKELSVYNYGGKNLSKDDITYSLKIVGNKTVIDLDIPYSFIGATSEDIFGISCGLWCENASDWAPMQNLSTTNVSNVEQLSTYVRCDKDNQYFESPINDYKENVPTVSYNKAELTDGYPYAFANPYNVYDQNADDIYLKTTKTTDGYQFDMVGFGTFSDNETVKLVIHNSEVNGETWAIQESDISFLISNSKACKRTGITDFWNYKVFGSDEQANNAPVYQANEKGYFTLSFTVDFTEIPNYDANKEIKFIAVELWDGNLYSGLGNESNVMTHNGIGVGDPAMQANYVVLQEKTLTVDKDTLIEGYNIKFSSNYYAKITRSESGITLDILSFETLNSTDFVRFVVDTDGTPVNGTWAMDENDVSFTIYDDIAYISTGNDWFWDLENNNNGEYKFHSGDEALNVPTYTDHGEYWTLSLFIQYDELGLNVTQESSLKGLLVAFKGSTIVNEGFTVNGSSQGDIASQSNYFVI